MGRRGREGRGAPLGHVVFLLFSGNTAEDSSTQGPSTSSFHPCVSSFFHIPVTLPGWCPLSLLPYPGHRSSLVALVTETPGPACAYLQDLG